MSSTLPPGTLASLAATPAVLRTLLGQLPSQLIERRDAGGWSARDVVAHLLSVEGPAFRERIGALAGEEDPDVPNVDEEEALRQSGYRERPLDWLLAELEQRRADDVAWFGTLPDLARPGRHGTVGPITITNVLSHMAYHDAAHIAQVAGILAAAATEGRGNLRRFDAPAP